MAPPAPPAPPAALPQAAPPQTTATATLDPLTAPLGVVLGQDPPPAAAVDAPPVTWPCVECGAHNDLDRNACAVCTAPFGGRIARLDDPKGQRRRIMVVALGAVGLFLMLLAALTFATTNTTNGGGGGSELTTEPAIDYSTLPQE